MSFLHVSVVLFMTVNHQGLLQGNDALSSYLTGSGWYMHILLIPVQFALYPVLLLGTH